MLGLVERFGAQSILGRQLFTSEIYRMLYAERVVKAFQDREKSQNWAAWEKENPDSARILSEAEILSMNEDNNA